MRETTLEQLLREYPGERLSLHPYVERAKRHEVGTAEVKTAIGAICTVLMTRGF